jgi:hypothetical protein
MKIKIDHRTYPTQELNACVPYSYFFALQEVLHRQYPWAKLPFDGVDLSKMLGVPAINGPGILSSNIISSKFKNLFIFEDTIEKSEEDLYSQAKQETNSDKLFSDPNGIWICATWEGGFSHCVVSLGDGREWDPTSQWKSDIDKNLRRRIVKVSLDSNINPDGLKTHKWWYFSFLRKYLVPK